MTIVALWHGLSENIKMLVLRTRSGISQLQELITQTIQVWFFVPKLKSQISFTWVMNSLIGQGVYGMAPLHRCHRINRILWTKDYPEEALSRIQEFWQQPTFDSIFRCIFSPCQWWGLSFRFHKQSSYISTQLSIDTILKQKEQWMFRQDWF